MFSDEVLVKPMAVDLHKAAKDWKTAKWLTLAPPESISVLAMKVLRREDLEETGYAKVREGTCKKEKNKTLIDPRGHHRVWHVCKRSVLGDLQMGQTVFQGTRRRRKSWLRAVKTKRMRMRVRIGENLRRSFYGQVFER